MADAPAPSACVQALEQVATLETLAPVYQAAARDERHFLDDADRPAELARVQKIVAASCSANPRERADQEAAAARLHEALSPECAVERDKLAALQLPSSREPRDSIERTRQLVADRCPAVDVKGRWLVQWGGRGELVPEQ